MEIWKKFVSLTRVRQIAILVCLAHLLAIFAMTVHHFATRRLRPAKPIAVRTLSSSPSPKSIAQPPASMPRAEPKPSSPSPSAKKPTPKSEAKKPEPAKPAEKTTASAKPNPKAQPPSVSLSSLSSRSNPSSPSSPSRQPNHSCHTVLRKMRPSKIKPCKKSQKVCNR